MLRLAACLEEHYPHSMAKAVVAEAARREPAPRGAALPRGVSGRTRHLQQCRRDRRSSSAATILSSTTSTAPSRQGNEAKFDVPARYSIRTCTWLSPVCWQLSSALRIRCGRKRPMSSVVCGSSACRKLVMMTGDNEKTARAVAEAVGVDAYFAEVLPGRQGRTSFRREHAAGPQGHHAGRRRERFARRFPRQMPVLPSVTARPLRAKWPILQLGADDLYALLTLKRLSDALMDAHPRQLPQDHQLQLPTDLPGRGRCPAARDLGAAA